MSESLPLSPYDRVVVKALTGFDPCKDSLGARMKTQPLSAQEIEILKDGGAIFPDPSEINDLEARQLQDLVFRCREVLGNALEEAEVAELLQVPVTDVQGYARRQPPLLHRFELEGRDLFPNWQFTEAGTLPFLESLLSVAESNESVSNSPLTFSTIMFLPNCDLEDGDETMCPRDWLMAGGDPEPVLNLVRFL